MSNFNYIRWLGMSLVLALASPGYAQVHRCKDASGKLSFSDRPCDSGQSGALIQRKRSQDEIEQERLQAAEAQYQKEARRAREENGTASVATSVGAVQGSAQPVSDWACRNAQRNFDVTASGSSHSAKAKAEALRDEEKKVNKACGTNSTLYANPPLSDPPAKAPFKMVAGSPTEPELSPNPRIKKCVDNTCTDTNGVRYKLDYGQPGQYRSPTGQRCRQDPFKGWVCQ